MVALEKPRKGTARMRELGNTSVVIWLDKEEVAALDRVRRSKARAKWCRETVLAVIRVNDVPPNAR